ncbi:GAF domain-containing protein [Peijinzhouia sedimentorum]
MSETLILPESKEKEAIYQAILPQIEALLFGEEDEYANMANMAAALKEAFNFFWVGFYIVKKDQLVLGPFQGPIACTRINLGKGVCGTSWQKKQTLIVEDVDAFPGHIACNSASKSEIVVPGIQGNEVKFVLDVDSDQLNDFDNIDQQYLEQLVQLLLK